MQGSSAEIGLAIANTAGAQMTPAVASAVREAATCYGLSPGAADELREGCEALLRRIAGSPDDGEDAGFEVTVSRRPGRVMMQVDDQGVPYELADEAASDPQAASTRVVAVARLHARAGRPHRLRLPGKSGQPGGADQANHSTQGSRRRCGRRPGGFARLDVTRIGAGLTDAMRVHLDRLERGGIATACVDLPLSLSETPAACDELERLALSFAGVHPSSDDAGWRLRLQRVDPHADIERDDIAVASEFGAELRDYVVDPPTADRG